MVLVPVCSRCNTRDNLQRICEVHYICYSCFDVIAKYAPWFIDMYGKLVECVACVDNCVPADDECPECFALIFPGKSHICPASKPY